jgi:hypothetical protein
MHPVRLGAQRPRPLGMRPAQGLALHGVGRAVTHGAYQGFAAAPPEVLRFENPGQLRENKSVNAARTVLLGGKQSRAD